MDEIKVGTVIVKSRDPKEMIPAFVAELERLSPGATADLKNISNLGELTCADECTLVVSLVDRLNRLDVVPEDVFFGLDNPIYGSHEEWAWRRIE